MVSVPVVPKLNPNHVGIGSRTERLRVLRRRKLENSLRFSFLLLVTHWFAGLNVGSMNISDQRKNLRDFHFMHII